jgi:exodeoxyribonuclease VII large subunit
MIEANQLEDKSGRKIVSVTELTFSIKKILETNRELINISVRGEISNFTKHTSGHLYFSIKDKTSQLNCVMFRSKALSLKFEPKHGDKVIVTGNITVYEARGNYQLLVTEMEKDGLGELHKKFLELKEKLEKEGLFEQKRKIPTFPKTIGIVSSPTSAALQDILDTIKRRFPVLKVIIAPAIVQGEFGTASIVKAIQQLNKLNETQSIDTMIIARGGGSLEDLWCFNEESVARAVFDSKIPTISGIGHETDFTITDFVVDLRAPTPSIAAERAVPVKNEIVLTLKDARKRLVKLLEGSLAQQKQYLDDITYRITTTTKINLQKKKELFNILQSKLSSLDVNQVLQRGYSITMKGNEIVKNIHEIDLGEEIKTILAQGEVSSKITNKSEKKEV